MNKLVWKGNPPKIEILKSVYNSLLGIDYQTLEDVVLKTLELSGYKEGYYTYNDNRIEEGE